MRRYRLLAVAVAGVVAVGVGLLFVGNLNANLVYYVTPSEALDQRGEFADGDRFRLGGFVVDDTVTRTADGLRFLVTDDLGSDDATVSVEHTGAPAQLFRSGIGVVLEGAWRGEMFVSDTMQVKHDENYAPPSDSREPAEGSP